MEFLAPLVVAFVGGSLGGAVFQWLSTRREHDIKMVEIGLAILKEDPKKTEISPARDWAIELVEKYSRVSFSEKTKQDLLRKGVTFDSYAWEGLMIKNVVLDKSRESLTKILKEMRNQKLEQKDEE